jgi:nifR3 family TIM-barrel protein
MGCPARHVTGGQSGSALMRDLDHALKLIEATISAVKVPVTLKMRLGWDDRSLNAPELARRAEAAGVQLISVHGRTRCQFYKGEADWSAVRAVRDAIKIPLVVNGDITSFEKAVTALEMSGADAVMIGRGAQGQPWLPGQIGRRLETGIAESAPSLTEQLNHIRALYDEVCSLYGLRIGLRHARKHLGWALEIAAQCSCAPATTLKNWRQKILTSDDPSGVHRSLTDAFDDFAWSAAA